MDEGVDGSRRRLFQCRRLTRDEDARSSQTDALPAEGMKARHDDLTCARLYNLLLARGGGG